MAINKDTIIVSFNCRLQAITTYLKTRYVGKEHGGWNIYEDDRIKIAYDTYFPDIEVSAKLNGEWKEVYIFSNRGIVQLYNPGRWEKHIDKLYQKTLKAKKSKERKRK